MDQETELSLDGLSTGQVIVLWSSVVIVILFVLCSVLCVFRQCFRRDVHVYPHSLERDIEMLPMSRDAAEAAVFPAGPLICPQTGMEPFPSYVDPFDHPGVLSPGHVSYLHCITKNYANTF